MPNNGAKQRRQTKAPNKGAKQDKQAHIKFQIKETSRPFVFALLICLAPRGLNLCSSNLLSNLFGSKVYNFATMDSNITMNSSTPQLNDNHSWKPDSIKVQAGDGRPPIELCVHPDPFNILSKTFNSKDIIEFPPDVYPPKWEARSILEQAIIEAAMNNTYPTHLVRGRQIQQKLSYLMCTYALPFERTGVHREYLQTLQQNTFKPGIRIDPIVGKKAGNREDGKKLPRRTNSTKLDMGMQCKLKIVLNLDPGRCWFVKLSCNKLCHCNHPKLDKTEMRRPMNAVPKEEKEDMAVVHRYAPMGSAKNIAQQKTGFCQSKSQLKKNRIKTEQANGKLPPPPPKSSKEDYSASGAAELMEYLQMKHEQGEMHYVALYHEIQETSLAVITMADKAKKEKEERKRRKQEEATKKQAGGGDTEDETDDSDGEGEEENDPPGLSEATKVQVTASTTSDGGNLKTSDFELSKKEQLGLGSFLLPWREKLVIGQRILLGVAWSRCDEIRLFELFPEVLMFDVTNGTNNEFRPQIMTCSIDGHNKAFTPVRGFLPSQCQWVFNWLLRSAIPTLLGKENVNRTQLFLTDGDSNMYNAFEAVQADQLYKHALHGLCLYHLVTKGIEKLGKKIRGKEHPEIQALLHT